MNIRRQGWSCVVALGVAYLLVLQILLAGVALGAHAAPVQLGGTGAVLCTTVPQDSVPQGPQSLPHLPDCCALGCLGGTAAPPPSTSVTTLAPAPREGRAGFRPSVATTRGDTSWHIPQNSRAPPRAV